MGDSVDVAPAKKGKATKAKKTAKTAPSHPKVSEMVNSAISTLKERGGSSLQAIKKYVSVTYKVDAEKLSPFIKKYLKSSVASGGLVQTKGKGATGSFRIGGTAAAVKKPAQKKAKISPLKARKAAKPATPKKAPAAKPKKAAAKKAAKKSPAKKAAKPAAKKSPAKKPKAVKLATKKAKTSPKKAAAKKGKK